MLLFLLLINGYGSAYFTPLQEVKNWQNEIESAYTLAIAEGSPAPIEELLVTLTVESPPNTTPIASYWLAYAYYHQAFFALAFLQDEQLAENAIEKTIALLRPANSDTESMALLSLSLGFSTQFKHYFKVMKIGQEALQLSKKAAELDPTNPRASYAYALIDFNMPKIFGGGEKVENLLLNALEHPEDPSPTAPSWGREAIYELLVKHYREKGDDQKAAYFLKEALSEFPSSRLLVNLKKQT